MQIRMGINEFVRLSFVINLKVKVGMGTVRSVSLRWHTVERADIQSFTNRISSFLPGRSIGCVCCQPVSVKTLKNTFSTLSALLGVWWSNVDASGCILRNWNVKLGSYPPHPEKTCSPGE